MTNSIILSVSYIIQPLKLLAVKNPASLLIKTGVFSPLSGLGFSGSQGFATPGGANRQLLHILMCLEQS
jgi:hypothetical protein